MTLYSRCCYCCLLTCCYYPYYCYGGDDGDDEGGGELGGVEGGGGDLQQPLELESHPRARWDRPAPIGLPTAADRTSWVTKAAKGQVMKCWYPL